MGLGFGARVGTNGYFGFPVVRVHRHNAFMGSPWVVRMSRTHILCSCQVGRPSRTAGASTARGPSWAAAETATPALRPGGTGGLTPRGHAGRPRGHKQRGPRRGPAIDGPTGRSIARFVRKEGPLHCIRRRSAAKAPGGTQTRGVRAIGRGECAGELLMGGLLSECRLEHDGDCLFSRRAVGGLGTTGLAVPQAWQFDQVLPMREALCGKVCRPRCRPSVFGVSYLLLQTLRLREVAFPEGRVSKAHARMYGRTVGGMQGRRSGTLPKSNVGLLAFDARPRHSLADDRRRPTAAAKCRG